MKKETASIIKNRIEIKRLFEEYVYGVMPPRPKHLTIESVSEDRAFAAGKATFRRATIRLEFEGGGTFALPVSCAIPNGASEPCPAFVHINYTGNMPNVLQPTEEICDGGCAVFTLNYEALVKSDGGFRHGICTYVSRGRRRGNSTGKLAIWAWGAMRVMDYIEELPEIDKARVAVIGHGILATSALLAGAYDERFGLVISSSSGFGGAADSALSRGELFELKTAMPELFCPRYARCIGKESALPIKQHQLLELIAPRRLLLNTATDLMSCAPYAELFSATLASEAYHAYGLLGLACNSGDPCEVFDENLPLELTDGRLGFRMRGGTPYISREDWAIYIKAIKRNDKS